ncbi:hypothetical protein ABVK25_009335 [Lepraria finkii]|uniref:Uncharacterized protein n=1 Tax=Lepraria finkii TaxID=1340010 RepID=A0ABR4B3J6_9LECA
MHTTVIDSLAQLQVDRFSSGSKGHWSPQAATSSAIEEYHVHSKDDLLDGSEHDVAERDDSGHDDAEYGNEPRNDDAGNKDDSEHDHAENMAHPEHHNKTGNDPEQDAMPQEGYESRAVGKLLDIMDKKEIELNLPYQDNTAFTVETMIILVDSVFKNIHVPSTLFNKFVLVDDKGKVTSRINHTSLCRWRAPSYFASRVHSRQFSLHTRWQGVLVPPATSETVRG